MLAPPIQSRRVAEETRLAELWSQGQRVHACCSRRAMATSTDRIACSKWAGDSWRLAQTQRSRAREFCYQGAEKVSSAPCVLSARVGAARTVRAGTVVLIGRVLSSAPC